MFSRLACGLLAAALVQTVPAAAQESAAAPAGDAASAPSAEPATVLVDYELPDPATLTMPKLAFTPSPTDEADFDKYFYFHRADVTFAEAYADIRECDALASGSSIYLGGNSAALAGATAQYGVLAAGIGSAVGSLLADAIFGSAARRQQRRVNLRNCMGFKGYQRYGLTGDLWKDFNFEEGHGRKKEGERDNALELQALVASGPKPVTKELGL